MKIFPMKPASHTSALSTLRLPRTFLPLLLTASLSAIGIGHAWANSSGQYGHTVINGSATFSRQGNILTITNTSGTVIEWKSFSIGAGQTVNFVQGSSSSSVLNRITGQSPTVILGTLTSNGRVFLINPNGVIFGVGSQVNVSSLVASTLAISNQDFAAGINKFTAGAVAGNVTNNGSITTPAGGQVFLIAPNVTNNGIITSPKGDVMLVAGHSVQLADSTNPDIHVVVSAPTDQAINLGQVIAHGGQIGVYGALIDQRGTLNVNSAVVGKNGKIILQASDTTLLEAGSVTTATGAGTGGEIQVLGTKVGLMGDARVDVSGRNGGGTVLVGGDYHGNNPAVMNADQVYVDKDAKISADAIVRGNGGKVIVWGNQTAQVYGSISVRGGKQSGDGGFVETSGHYLDVAGVRVDASAANGKFGQWLLDPYDLNIVTGGNDPALSTVAAFANPPSTGITTLNTGLFSGVTSNVTLQATHDITFTNSISFGVSGVGLKAQAGNNINVNASITTNGGTVTLSANDNGGGTATGSGKVNRNAAISGGTLIVTDSTTNPPPSADICTIAPNSALCQILSPPTASQPVKPVQQATNEVIRTITTPPPMTASTLMPPPATSTTSSSGGSTTGTTTTAPATTSTTSTSSDAKSDTKKDDTKVVATQDSGVKTNDTAKKMYCN